MRSFHPFYLIVAILALFASGCKDPKPIVAHEWVPLQNQSRYQLDPIKLVNGKAQINLKDIFYDTCKVDSVGTLPGYTIKLDTKKNILSINGRSDSFALLFLKVWVSGFPYSIPLEKVETRNEIILVPKDGAKYKSVMVKGELEGALRRDFEGNWSGKFNVLANQSYCFQVWADGKILNCKLPMDSQASLYHWIYPRTIDSGSALHLDVHQDIANTLFYVGSKDELRYTVIWNNFEIYSSELRKGKFALPAQAMKMDRSRLTFFVADRNEHYISSQFIIEKGRILRDVSLLKQGDPNHHIAYFCFSELFNGGADSSTTMNSDSSTEAFKYLKEQIKQGYFKRFFINDLYISALPQSFFYESPKDLTKASGPTTVQRENALADISKSSNLNVFQHIYNPGIKFDSLLSLVRDGNLSGLLFSSENQMLAMKKKGLMDSISRERQFEMNTTATLKSKWTEKVLFCLSAEEGAGMEMLVPALMQKSKGPGQSEFNLVGSLDLIDRMSSYSSSLENKNIGKTNEQKIQPDLHQRELAFLQLFLQFCAPGKVALVQGSEYGMALPSGFQEDQLTEEQLDWKNRLIQLAGIRESGMALLYGSVFPVYADHDILVFSRSYLDQHAIIAISKSAEPKSLHIDLPPHLQKRFYRNNFNQNFRQSDTGIDFEFSPFAYELLQTW